MQKRSSRHFLAFSLGAACVFALAACESGEDVSAAPGGAEPTAESTGEAGGAETETAAAFDALDPGERLGVCGDVLDAVTKATGPRGGASPAEAETPSAEEIAQEAERIRGIAEEYFGPELREMAEDLADLVEEVAGVAGEPGDVFLGSPEVGAAAGSAGEFTESCTEGLAP